MLPLGDLLELELLEAVRVDVEVFVAVLEGVRRAVPRFVRVGHPERVPVRVLVADRVGKTPTAASARPSMPISTFGGGPVPDPDPVVSTHTRKKRRALISVYYRIFSV